MPPKKPPWTLYPSTREKRKASQSIDPVAKSPRSRARTLTRTIHQQVKDTVSTVAGASNSGSPSVLTAHPFRVQHASSHTPSPGYGLPPSNQSPAQWWGPWGPPPPWAQYYQQWPPLSTPNVLGNVNTQTFHQQPVQNN